MTLPLVSICMPTRNRAASLRHALENVRALDYPALEIIISDNGSDDGTEQVCREQAAADPRIQYVRHGQNIGLYGNHNYCLGAGGGKYLCICHDHDVRDAAIVRKYVAFLEAHPRVGLVCADWNMIDDDDREIGVRINQVPDVTPGLEYIGRTVRSGRTSIAIPGAMIRREALAAARIAPDAPIGYGDFPLWFRIAETWDIGHVHERLWSWRQNAVSLSARPIETVVRDYDLNLSAYFEDHLTRWPAHGALVRKWRGSMRHYAFWALGYEIALHFRNAASMPPGDGERSVFDLMGYRLTPEQFDHALAQMKSYRTGPTEYAAYTALSVLIALHLTRPLAWMSRHQAALRAVLGLR